MACASCGLLCRTFTSSFSAWVILRQLLDPSQWLWLDFWRSREVSTLVPFRSQWGNFKLSWLPDLACMKKVELVIPRFLRVVGERRPRFLVGCVVTAVRGFPAQVTEKDEWQKGLDLVRGFS